MASRHALLIGGLWVAAAVAATSVGVVAVRLVGNQVGDSVSDPLTSAGVQQALGTATPTPEPSEQVHPATPRPTDEGVARTVSTAGGVVSARCAEGMPALLYATPADGYRTVRGSSVVRFVGRSRQVTVTLGCHDDELQVATRTDRIGTGTTRSTTPSPLPAPTARASSAPAPDPSEHPDASESPSDDSGGSFEGSIDG